VKRIAGLVISPDHGHQNTYTEATMSESMTGAWLFLFSGSICLDTCVDVQRCHAVVLLGETHGPTCHSASLNHGPCMVSLVQQTGLLYTIAYAVSMTAVQSISLLTHKDSSCEQRWRNTSILNLRMKKFGSISRYKIGQSV